MTNVRYLFDIPKTISYLNCAYMSPLATPVVEAGIRGVNMKSMPWQLSPEDFFSESEQTRAKFASLINASAEDICFVPSVSYGVTLAMRNLRVRPDQSILVLSEQFPSNVYPWVEFARQHGATLTRVERGRNLNWTDSILKSMESCDPGVLALPNCHWTDGAFIDLNRISEACKSTDAALVVDATQSLGALPLDASKIKPDFLICATYKWLLGPYSVGFTYVDPKHHGGEPMEHGWITRRKSENFRTLVDYETEYQAGARRYDVGERSNFALMPMVSKALDLIIEWDPLEIQKQLGRYTTEIERAVRDLGLISESIPDRADHFLGIRFPDGLPTRAVEVMSQEGIYVSARGDSIRVTPHLYNTEHDKTRFLQVIERLADVG